jgi:hypothetical protein
VHHSEKARRNRSKLNTKSDTKGVKRSLWGQTCVQDILDLFVLKLTFYRADPEDGQVSPAWNGVCPLPDRLDVTWNSSAGELTSRDTGSMSISWRVYESRDLTGFFKGEPRVPRMQLGRIAVTKVAEEV